MKTLALTLILLSCVSGCAATPRAQVLDPDSFNAHFADQRNCAQYVNSLVSPVVAPLAGMATVDGMRMWLRQNPEFDFAKIVLRIQDRTAKERPVDPKSEDDQLKVVGHLSQELARLPGFERSGCGPDVREAIMESLYLGVGGKRALVAQQLSRNGVSGSWEQRWVLLTALLAGELDPQFQ